MQIPLASVFACLFLLNTCIHSSYTLTHTCNKHKHFHSNSEKVSGSLPVCIKLSAPLDGEQPKCVYIFIIFSCRATTPRLHVHTFCPKFLHQSKCPQQCRETCAAVTSNDVAEQISNSKFQLVLYVGPPKFTSVCPFPNSIFFSQIPF